MSADDGLFAINELQLQSEFTRIAADIARWNELFAEATADYRLAEHQLETVESTLYLHYKGHADSLGQKVTEAALKAKVLTDPQYQEASVALIQEERQMLKAKGVVGALITKRDMLISLGAHIRAELHGDPALRTTKQDKNKFDWSKQDE